MINWEKKKKNRTRQDAICFGRHRAETGQPRKTTRWRHEAQTSSFAPRWWFPPSSSLFINSFISFFFFLSPADRVVASHTQQPYSQSRWSAWREEEGVVSLTRRPFLPKKSGLSGWGEKTHTHTYREKEVVPSRFFFNTHDQKEKKKKVFATSPETLWSSRSRNARMTLCV